MGLSAEDFDWRHTERGRVNHAVPLGTPPHREYELAGDRVRALCGANVYPFPPHNAYPRCTHCLKALEGT